MHTNHQCDLLMAFTCVFKRNLTTWRQRLCGGISTPARTNLQSSLCCSIAETRRRALPAAGLGAWGHFAPVHLDKKETKGTKRRSSISERYHQTEKKGACTHVEERRMHSRDAEYAYQHARQPPTKADEYSDTAIGYSQN